MKNLRGSSSEVTFTGHQGEEVHRSVCHHTASLCVLMPTFLDWQLFSVDSDLRGRHGPSLAETVEQASRGRPDLSMGTAKKYVDHEVAHTCHGHEHTWRRGSTEGSSKMCAHWRVANEGEWEES